MPKETPIIQLLPLGPRRAAAELAQRSDDELMTLAAAGLVEAFSELVVAPGILLAPPEMPVSYYRLKFLAHDGAPAGYSANLSCLPEESFCFVTLANGDGADFIGSLVTAISTLVDLPAPSAPPDLSPRPDRFPAHAGTYDDPFALGEVDVTARADGPSVLVPTLDPTTRST